MGMTAPGLYRYFASHDDLVVGVCHDILDELTVVLLAARDTVRSTTRSGGWGRPAGPSGAGHSSTPLSSSSASRPAARRPASPVPPAAWSAGGGGALRRRLPRPPRGGLDSGAVSGARGRPASRPDSPGARVSAVVGDVLPLGALTAYLAGWVRFLRRGHHRDLQALRFALDDAEPMFEAMLAEMARASSRRRRADQRNATESTSGAKILIVISA